MTVLGNLSIEATAAHRSNFANLHIRSAKVFALRVNDLEKTHRNDGLGAHFDEIQSASVACILCATSAVEAFAAEVVFEPAAHFPNAPPALLQNLERTTPRNIQPRIEFLSRLNDREPPNFGQGIGQRWSLLKALRNQIVHFSPAWPGEPGPHANLSTSLRGQFAPSIFLPPEEQLFPRAWASYSCCHWVMTTARDFVIQWAANNTWQCGFEKTLRGTALPAP